MKRKDIKPLVMSALASLALGAVGTVGTFALFTDQAETTVQIGAGTVHVESEVKIISYSELGGVAATSDSSGVYTNSIGGSVKVTGSTVSLSNWAPGDKAVLEVRNINYSDIKTKIHFVETHTFTSTKDLYQALDISYKAYDANDVDITHKFMEWQVTDAASDTVGGTLVSRVRITIEFKDHDNGQIRFGEDNQDNQYQGMNCSILYKLEAVQANASVASLIDQLNADLLAKSHATMHEALDEVSDIASAAQISAAGYVWNAVEDQFYYPEEATTNQYRFFKIYESMPTSSAYSIYANATTWNVSSITLTGIGFDAGSASGISSISYGGASDARTNIIRTNSASTSLTIDAANDIVHHYGDVGALNIIAVANASYHEFGKAAYVEIKNGRMVLEAASKVEKIHLNATESTTDKYFDEITIAKAGSVQMPAFSRDPVEIPDEGRLVVALQDGTDTTDSKDYVWLTAVGIYEQVAVSNNKDSSISTEQTQPTFAATDTSVSEAKKGAAQQIANNISFSEGGEDYKVTATPVIQGNVVTGWNYVVENSENAVSEEYVAEVKDDKIVVSSDATGVVATTVENGLTEEQKYEAKAEVIEEAVSKEFVQDEEAADYVIRIGETGYLSLDAALEAAVDGDTLVFLKDITVSGAVTNSSTAALISIDKDITLSLGNHVITNNVTGGRMFFINADVTITAKNGGITIPAENTASTGLLRVGGTGNTLTVKGGNYLGNTNNGVLFHVYGLSYATVNLIDIHAETNYRFLTSGGNPNGNGVFGTFNILGGSYIHRNENVRYKGLVPAFYFDHVQGRFEGVSLTSDLGAGCEVWGSDENENGVVFERNDIRILGTSANIDDETPWNSVPVAVSGGGIVTINSGNYSGSRYGAYVFNSGGTMTINGGTFTGSDNAVRADWSANNASVNSSEININGGTFNGTLAIDVGTTPDHGGIFVSGGRFSVNPTGYVKAGFQADLETDSDYYVVTKTPVVELKEIVVSSGMEFSPFMEEMDGHYNFDYAKKTLTIDAIKFTVSESYSENRWALFGDEAGKHLLTSLLDVANGEQIRIDHVIFNDCVFNFSGVAMDAIQVGRMNNQAGSLKSLDFNDCSFITATNKSCVEISAWDFGNVDRRGFDTYNFVGCYFKGRSGIDIGNADNNIRAAKSIMITECQFEMVSTNVGFCLRLTNPAVLDSNFLDSDELKNNVIFEDNEIISCGYVVAFYKTTSLGFVDSEDSLKTGDEYDMDKCEALVTNYDILLYVGELTGLDHVAFDTVGIYKDEANASLANAIDYYKLAIALTNDDENIEAYITENLAWWEAYMDWAFSQIEGD